jgi:hypothetical protein
VEEIHHTGQKEKRIIDVLEPVLNQHRLVVDRKVIQKDYESTQEEDYGQNAASYQAFYQLTRITKDRGSLVHDDRLEALAMGVAYWVESMARDTDKAARDQHSKLIDLELKTFIRSATQTLTGRRAPVKQKTWM